MQLFAPIANQLNQAMLHGKVYILFIDTRIKLAGSVLFANGF
jgi:hypothetical protein